MSGTLKIGPIIVGLTVITSDPRVIIDRTSKLKDSATLFV